MEVFQTAGAPPSKGRASLLNRGWTMKSSDAFRKMTAVKSAGRAIPARVAPGRTELVSRLAA